MFPNVRLVIGALFITVLVLSCEFGVFAALRVNREPLSRLTSESAPLQLVTGKDTPAAVPVSWTAPHNAQTAAGDMQTSAIMVEVPAANLAERAIETPVPSNDGATGALDNDNQTNPAALQTALAPLPAAPAPAAAPIADAAPIAEPPIPLQETAAPAAAGNIPPEQTAAALAAAPPQQTPVAEIVKPAEAAPPQAASAPQPDETAAPAGEPPASSAPVIAAIAPAAAEPVAAQPVEITGSVPNAAMPETAAAPKAAAPHAKPLSKIVHKPAAKKPHKVAHAPTQAHHPVKKRIARRVRPPAASAAQSAGNFQNPVFQSAPQFQRPTKSRPGAKNAVTNNGFNTFGTQFGTQ